MEVDDAAVGAVAAAVAALKPSARTHPRSTVGGHSLDLCHCVNTHLGALTGSHRAPRTG